MRRLAAGVGGWILLSLAVRLVLWCWVASHGVPPLHDEASYLDLAEGWTDVWRTGGDGAWARALGDGRWPPLHAMVLGLGVMVAGLDGARLVGVFLSAATTGLVFAVSRRLVGVQAARTSAFVHVVAPAFLFYSHSLWSENLALFLAFGSLLLTLEARRRLAQGESALAHGAGAGLVLGALALTRVAMWPWALIMPLWLVLAPANSPSHPTRNGGRLGDIGRRLRPAAACLCASVAAVTPWLAVQAERFDHRGLSTLSGYNLALGNHADVPTGYGSSWGHAESTRTLQAELRRRASEDGTEWWRGAGALAAEAVRGDPSAAILRIPVRLWLLLAPDVLPVRHLLHATYPPLPSALTRALVLGIVLAHGFLLAAGVAGLLWRRRSRAGGLVPLLLLAGLVPPALSVALTRVFLPLEALLLPAVGALWVSVRGRRSGRRSRPPRWIVAVGLGLTAASWATLPRVAELYWRPSLAAAPAIGRVAVGLGAEMLYVDRYRLERAADDGADLRLELRASDRALLPRPWLESEAPNSRVWSGATIEFDVVSSGPQGGPPSELGAATVEVLDGDGRRLGRWSLRPMGPWREPQRDADLTLTWLGGGGAPR
ncbi:MAG: hypothetical protein AAGM22_13030 [Acidobacteriota bacterium]